MSLKGKKFLPFCNDWSNFLDTETTIPEKYDGFIRSQFNSLSLR